VLPAYPVDEVGTAVLGGSVPGDSPGPGARSDVSRSAKENNKWQTRASERANKPGSRPTTRAHPRCSLLLLLL
jgi:hypothetical protein